ncbi:MAG: hypothetical protein P1V36_10795 [Planctomycetota bacterium]|nr:hypothetical protein [Planctomycetota bacterium]
MQPHLVRWQQQYGSQGLQIVYVDDARRDSMANAQRLAAAAPYAWYYDVGGRWASACSVRAYPTAYIVTQRDGYRVVWEGIPVLSTAATEQAIQAALRR